MNTAMLMLFHSRTCAQVPSKLSPASGEKTQGSSWARTKSSKSLWAKSPRMSLPTTHICFRSTCEATCAFCFQIAAKKLLKRDSAKLRRATKTSPLQELRQPTPSNLTKAWMLLTDMRSHSNHSSPSWAFQQSWTSKKLNCSQMSLFAAKVRFSMWSSAKSSKF